MSYILVIGAKSDIAKAIARQYAKHGYNLYLAARKSRELEEFAQDLNLRTGQIIQCLELDILDPSSHDTFYKRLKEKPYGVICAIGYLGDQQKAQNDFDETEKIINTNFTGIVNLINIIANDFEKRKEGFIVGISSVAGDRGRKSNYIYGSAKAALSSYLSGLRNRLNNSQVHVMTVKPGFVKTKMTEGMNLPKKLTIQSEVVAEAVFKAQQKGKSILYTKWIWKWVMLIIKLIPEWVFKRLSL